LKVKNYSIICFKNNNPTIKNHIMKTLIKILIISGLVLSINPTGAQTINWAGLDDSNKNIVGASLGIEYGLVYGLAYGRQINTKLFPLITSIEYSAPAGKNVLDDFKTEIGIKIRWFNLGNFQFSTKINGVFRRYENDFASLLNFGSDLSGILGYYKPRWFVAGEVGFDKAIVTHFKHSPEYQELNPTAANGWFEPSTGGNFYYGLQTGLTIRKMDINLRLGKILTQDFKTTPMIPFYAQVGFNMKF